MITIHTKRHTKLMIR